MRTFQYWRKVVHSRFVCMEFLMRLNVLVDCLSFARTGNCLLNTCIEGTVVSVLEGRIDLPHLLVDLREGPLGLRQVRTYHNDAICVCEGDIPLIYIYFQLITSAISVNVYGWFSGSISLYFDLILIIVRNLYLILYILVLFSTMIVTLIMVHIHSFLFHNISFIYEIHLIYYTNANAI